MKFSVRDLLLLTVIVALGTGWWPAAAFRSAGVRPPTSAWLMS